MSTLPLASAERRILEHGCRTAVRPSSDPDSQSAMVSIRQPGVPSFHLSSHCETSGSQRQPDCRAGRPAVPFAGDRDRRTPSNRLHGPPVAAICRRLARPSALRNEERAPSVPQADTSRSRPTFCCPRRIRTSLAFIENRFVPRRVLSPPPDRGVEVGRPADLGPNPEVGCQVVTLRVRRMPRLARGGPNRDEPRVRPRCE